jgi:PKD repeat protein
MFQITKRVSTIFLLLLIALVQGVSQSKSNKSLDEMFFKYDMRSIDSDNLHSTARGGDFFTIEIPKSDNGSWMLELHDSKVISDDYLSQYVDDEGVHDGVRTEAIATKGHVVGDLSTSASLTFNDGFIYGFIKDESGYNFIEPVSYYDNSMRGSDMFVIYNEKDVKPTAPKTCGNTELQNKRGEIENHKHSEESRSAVGECFEVDWAIANDFLMFDNLGSVAAVENHAIAVANNVQTNYDDEFADELQLVIVTQFTVTSSSADPWTSSTDASTILSSFRQWGPSGFGAIHDIGSLWTDRNFDGSTIGIAYLGVVCNSFRYNCLQDFTNNANTKRVMVAHELGHNFNANHDAGGSGFIMAPSVNVTNTWSSTSINAINSHVASRTCLATCIGSGTAPVADFDFTILDDCTIGEVIFTSTSSGSDLSYEWSFPGGFPSTSNEESPAVQYPDAGTYSATLTVTNASGTDEIVQNNIFTINPSPIVSFSYALDGTSASFFNFTQFGDTYLWDFGDGSTSIQSDPIYDFIDDGVYTVTLTATNICGDVTEEEIIVIATPPTADFNANVQEGCAPLTVQYTSNSSNNTDDFVWSFEGGTPSSSTEENPQVIYEEAGDWDVILTVLNETGDDVLQFTEFISIQGQPISDFSFDLDGNEVQFTNFSQFGETTIWTFGDGESSTEENPTYTYTEDGTYTVILTTENECGTNSASTEITISLAPQPSISIAGDVEGCAPKVVNFQSTSSNSPDTYAWVFEGGSPATSTAQNPQVTYITEGDYDVTLTVSNENGENTETFNDYISIFELPSVAFSSEVDGLTVSFEDESTGADSYAWSFGDGNTSTMANPTHTYDSEGIYTVILETTNQCGTTSEEVVINNYTPVTALFTSGATDGCADFEVEFSDQSSDNVTEWLWTFEGGSPATSTLQNPTVTYATAGQYNVILTVSHPESTETIMLENYIAVSDVPVTSFEYFDDLFEVDFTNTTVEGLSYSWNFGDGNSSTMENPSHTYTAEGTYTVILSATNDCGTTVSEQEIVINALPTAGFNAMNSIGCGPLSVAFNNASSSNVESLLWSFEGGNPSTSTEENPTVIYDNSGTYDVTLTVTSAAGTDISTLENFVIVIDEPTAEISTSASGNIINAVNTGVGTVSSTWSVDGVVVATDVDMLSYTFDANGEYEITLVVENDCGVSTTSTLVTIDVYPEVSYTDLPIVACVGDAIMLSDNSGNAESKVWTLPNGNPESSTDENPIVTYESAGSYDITLTVSNQFGESTETFTDAITIIDVPEASFDIVEETNTFSFISTSVGAITYSWNFGDGTGSDEENPTHTYTENGTYEVILTVTNPCGESQATASIIINVNAVTEQDFKNIKVFPNPANAYLSINIDNKSADDININIIDMQGRVVVKEVMNSENHTINTTNLLNGTYMLRLSSREASYLDKIVIMK